MIRIGIELGIRAPLKAVVDAGLMADSQMLDYYFIPETHPKFMGVDAFKALQYLAKKVQRVKLGTGIVNVYSRDKKRMLELAKKLYSDTKGNFILGLGTSAPAIIEKMYDKKFELPLSRIKCYSEYLKSHDYAGPVYWSVVGDKIALLAAQHADGAIFFLKPKKQICHSIKIIRSRLRSLGRLDSSFEFVSIRPVYITESEEKGRTMARFTIANYLGANEFYSKQLEGTSFEEEALRIRKIFAAQGLASASSHVSDELVSELATFGKPDKCVSELYEYAEASGIDTVMAGFDLPSDGYNLDFFENLHRLASRL